MVDADVKAATRARPASKMAFLQSQGMLAPVPTSRPGEVWDDVGAAAYGVANNAMLALDTLGRGRDAAFRALQEVNRPIINIVEGQNDTVPREGTWNPGAALAHLASIPSNMVAPLTGAKVVGGYGEPDDWRQYATPGNAMAIEMLTDPGNWVTLPSATAFAKRAGLAGRAANVGRKASGRIHSLDEAADAIRSLIAAPR